MSDETNFKVTDRRLFNSDGSPRDLLPEEKPEVIATEDTSVPIVEPLSHQPAPVAGGAGATASPAPDRAIDEEQDPASFVNFIMTIASNAASSLGMMEHPVTHQREVDIELAKHWIDVLGMLQQKTAGNLGSEEQEIMEGLLSDLRMQYVSLANATPPQSRRNYTGRDIIGGDS